MNLALWQRYFRSPERATNFFAGPTLLRPTAQDILWALDRYRDVNLREAAKLPKSRFPLAYDKKDPMEILLPHLAPLNRCSQILRLRAVTELQNNQTQAAFADIVLLTRLIESIHSEPCEISQMIRCSMFLNLIQPIWEGLADHRWSDGQLIELDSELAKYNFVADYRSSMLYEMAMQAQLANFLSKQPRAIVQVLDGFDYVGSGRPLVMVAYVVPSGWYYQNSLHAGKAMMKYFPAADPDQMIFSPP